MNITTGCPACGKTLTLDVRHKEAYAPPEKMVTAALAICEACREPLKIELLVRSDKPHEATIGEILEIYYREKHKKGTV